MRIKPFAIPEVDESDWRDPGGRSLSVVKPPVISEIFGRAGLSDIECKALHEVAYRLMVDGRALGVGQDEDGAFVTHRPKRSLRGSVVKAKPRSRPVIGR